MKLSNCYLCLFASSTSAFVVPSGISSRTALRAEKKTESYFMEPTAEDKVDMTVDSVKDEDQSESNTESNAALKPNSKPTLEKESDIEIVDIFSTAEELPGVAAPFGFVDPFDMSSRADAATMRRYREAELTHGRVGMLAAVGILAGEYVEGSSFLWNAQVTGPAITHLSQVPTAFWILLTVAIGASESVRLNIGWVDPKDVPADQAGLLRDDYLPGDIGFDPLKIMPTDPVALKDMQTKELQNGRLGMLAAVGFLAQELANGKGILENLGIQAHL